MLKIIVHQYYKNVIKTLGKKIWNQLLWPVKFSYQMLQVFGENCMLCNFSLLSKFICILTLSYFQLFDTTGKNNVLQLEVLWRLHFFGDNGQYHTMFPRMLFQADIRCSQKLMTFIDFLFLFHVKWQNISEIEAVNSASWVGYLGIRTKTRRPLKQIYKPTEQNRSIHWRRRI